MWALFELLNVRELNRVYSPLCSQSHFKLNLQPPNLMFPNTSKLCTFWQYSNNPPPLLLKGKSGLVFLGLFHLFGCGSFTDMSMEKLISAQRMRRLPSLNISYSNSTRDASIRYSGSVSAPIRSFSVDRVSERPDRSKSDILRILFCVIVKPHESTKTL